VKNQEKAPSRRGFVSFLRLHRLVVLVRTLLAIRSPPDLAAACLPVSRAHALLLVLSVIKTKNKEWKRDFPSRARIFRKASGNFNTRAECGQEERTMWHVLMFALLAAPVAESASVEGLAWLAGCWAQRRDGFVYEEQWMEPAGGVMLGMSRTLANGRLVGTEFLRIEVSEGSLRYTALPSGQALTVFTLRSLEGQRAVFENLEHDFPQRIIYRRDGEALTARIEGERDGRARAVDLPMRREACLSPAAS